MNPTFGGPNRPARILIVDDEPDNRRLLDVMLAPEGYLLATAASGAEALAAVSEQEPDLVLLDVKMPGMDGYQVAKQIKDNLATKPIPIIMITALDDREAMMLGLTAGADDFLARPVNRDELLLRVRNLLRLKAYGDHYAKYSHILEGEVDSREAELRQSVVNLTASEQRYRTLLDSANDAIAVLTAEGLIREVNQRWVDIAGLSRVQLVGRPFRDLAAASADDENARELDRAVASNATRSPCIEIVTPDGSNVLMDFSSTAISVAGERLVLMIGRDVTEQRQLEEQLRQAQKLEVLGQLAGGVAHDFNNLLTVILGASEILLADLDPAAPAYIEVAEIKKAGDRATGLTRQLLAFSRKQVLQPRLLKLNELVTDMEPLLRRLVAKHVDLVLSLEPDVGTLRIDPTQFEQLVVNLVVNAADAMPRGGKLTIETSNVRLDEHYRKHHLPVTPGDYLMLAVSDTGVGMDEATSQRIFEPFFTTKEVGKGTGLGLATVYGIVKQSGGDIWVYSEPGHGTAFKIYLPQMEAVASVAVELAIASAVDHGGSETILLVEDDEAVRRLARLSLERSGYNVVESENPKEAIRLADHFSGQIDLLLSDVVMPESEGPLLFHRLAKVRPSLRVLYMSGYADEAIVRHGIVVEGTPFLQKPFTPLSLSAKVRDVLDAPVLTARTATG